MILQPTPAPPSGREQPRDASAPDDQRAHWHQRATELAQLDCALLGLLSWEDRRLGRLPSASFATLMPKLTELVDWACFQTINFRKPEAIEYAMARAIWRLAKTLKPNLQPFSDY